MHLLIDGQALQTSSSRLRGIGRYSSNLLQALAAARSHWRIEVVQNNALPPIAPEDLAGRPVLTFHPPAPGSLRHQELNERYYADWLTARGADGVLVLSHCEGWEALVPSFCGPRPRLYGIAYDLIPLLYPERYLKDFSVSRWYAHRFRHLLKCDVLFAISEATARDVRFLGAEQTPQVVNIGGAVDPLFEPLSAEALASCAAHVRQCFALKREFLLYVGAADYRKNLEGTIRAFGALPADCRAPFDLAVVCRLKHAEKAAFEAIAHEAGVAPSLKLICSATDEDLRALYQMCRLFFFPSQREGFGLAGMEAAARGIPVLGVAGTVMSELFPAGHGIVLVNELREIAEAAIPVLVDNEYANALGQAAWERVNTNFLEEHFIERFRCALAPFVEYEHAISINHTVWPSNGASANRT